MSPPADGKPNNIWGVIASSRDVEEVEICNGGVPMILSGKTGGILLPLGGDWEAGLPDVLQAVIYLMGLLWCFLGVAIIADVFMNAIEKITSKKVLTTNPKTGRKVTVKVWNDSVANLTLMALGSSAPEILLSVIELLTGEFFSGELGPSTIVGSAAFNLLCIIAVCVSAIPAGEVRMIKDTGVFAVTAFFSVFAYIWVLFILVGPTPNVIDIGEGVMTFMWFWVLLVLAYLADIGVLSKMSRGLVGHSNRLVFSPDCSKEELAEMDKIIRKKYGDALSDDDVVALMEHEFSAPRSRAEYRVDATRAMTKGKKTVTGAQQERQEQNRRLSTRLTISKVFHSEAPHLEEPHVSFASANYSVQEKEGCVNIAVVRSGDMSKPAKVGYKTRDGTAHRGTDYEFAESVLHFKENEEKQSFTVTIVHDQAHERTEEFYVDLAALEGCTVGHIPSCTVVVIDSDSPGKLSFEHEQMNLQESSEPTKVTVVVNRTKGASGKVGCSFCTEDNSAVQGKDYVSIDNGVLEFEHGQMCASFEVEIMPKGHYEGTESFRIILKDTNGGVKFDETTDGGREQNILTIFIVADPATKSHVDKLIRYMDVNWDRVAKGQNRWKRQFIEAVFVNGSWEDQRHAGVFDWVTHLISLPWKVLFAFVPPTDFVGGWLCFVCALLMIGVVTAIIGDMANLLGCALGIKPSITAVTFVALGTSLPDTFASKSAATQDPFADASIGNVTGSNSVNVFLGLGLPWMMGAIYWKIKGAELGDEWHRTGFEMKWPDDIKLNHPDGAFVVVAGGLSISVAVFSVFAIICIGALVYRRNAYGGELGGKKSTAYSFSAFFVSLWFIYIGSAIAVEYM